MRRMQALHQRKEAGPLDGEVERGWNKLVSGGVIWTRNVTQMHAARIQREKDRCLQQLRGEVTW